MDVRSWSQLIVDEVGKVILGKEQVIRRLLIALLCRGHALLEDVPGVGKTILARALSLVLGGEFRRIQCTPDLLPADVLGVSVYNPKSGNFDFKEGPVMTNILLVDEVNRATPRTQSALLEAMAEGQVSVEGRSQPLPNPFVLIATESPVESEGTFPLPEVQKDRFFLSIKIGYPSREAEKSVIVMQRIAEPPLDRIFPVTGIDTLLEMQEAVMQVHVEPSIRRYILAIVNRTREDNRLMIGVSPRGSLAMFKGGQALAAVRGRDFVTPEDVRDLAPSVLRKRLLLKSEFSAKGLTEDAAVDDLLESVDVPPLAEAM
jgi:MoxR-like ATPase